MDPYEIETLTDEEIEARLNGIGSESEAPAETVEAQPEEQEQAAETPGDTEAPAPGSADQEAAQQAETPEAQQPRTVPLAEHIELRKRAQAAEAEAQRLQQMQAQREAEAQQRAIEARYEDLLLDDPEAAAQFAQQVQQQETQRIRAEFEQQQVMDRVGLSEQYARAAYGEENYERQLAKVVERFGAQTVLQMAAQQPNPAQWVYELGSQFQTPEERQAAIQAEVTKQVQEVLKKNQPPQSRGTTSIGTVSSATAEPHALKDPEQMTDAELEAADRAARARFR